MNIFKVVLVFGILISPAYASAFVSSKGATALDETKFKQSMDAAIEEQQVRINDLKSVVFNVNAPAVPGAGKKLTDATVILEVKQNLYDKFIDNSINKDPQFQAFLLQIMNQSTITEDDLNALQKAVTEAHAREK